MQSMIRGAVAGLTATAPMTATIAAGRAAGWLYTPPPAQITENVAEEIGEDPEPQSPAFQTVWIAAHFAYGAGCGVLYALLRPLLPRSNTVAGVLFGGAVWGVSYLGILPVLELFPSAKNDSPRRQAVMVAAHAVYGTALASLERVLRSQAGSEPPGH
jgi:uncharacterized membrane protein YagU involved in acid resistance